MTEAARVTKSEQMRKLYDEGKSIAEIARELNTYYSFVYRVIKRHTESIHIGAAATAEAEPIVEPKKQKGRKPSRKQLVTQMYQEGKTVDEISAELGIDATDAYRIIKKAKTKKADNKAKEA